MLMFFETNDFALSNISAFTVSRESSVGNSGVRPYHALSFRVSGDAVFSFEDDAVQASSGDIIFVPAYCQYHITTGAEQLFVIHFNTDRPIGNGIKKFSTKSTGIYQKYFEDITKACSIKEAGYEHEGKSILYKIIMNIERELENQKVADHSREIQKAIGYIHQNFTDRTISVQELAKSCSMSETYFRKLFEKHYGCSPLAYINQRRLDYAIELLKTKYYTVAEVSEKCGFSTPYYFSSFVKKKTGHPPIDLIKE